MEDTREGSTRKTGDDAASASDPGGTRPTRPAPETAPRVESGDRNGMTTSNPATGGDA